MVLFELESLSAELPYNILYKWKKFCQKCGKTYQNALHRDTQSLHSTPRPLLSAILPPYLTSTTTRPTHSQRYSPS